VAELRLARLSERLEALRRQTRQLQVMVRAVADAPDHQVSLTHGHRPGMFAQVNRVRVTTYVLPWRL